jgi:hypothetical protein
MHLVYPQTQGLLNRPTWQGSEPAQKHRAQADVLEANRDLIVLNALLEAFAEEAGGEASARATARSGSEPDLGNPPSRFFLGAPDDRAVEGALRKFIQLRGWLASAVDVFQTVFKHGLPGVHPLPAPGGSPSGASAGGSAAESQSGGAAQSDAGDAAAEAWTPPDRETLETLLHARILESLDKHAAAAAAAAGARSSGAPPSSQTVPQTVSQAVLPAAPAGHSGAATEAPAAPPPAGGSTRLPSVSVTRVLGARIVDAFFAWDGCSREVDAEDIGDADAVALDERGHSIALSDRKARGLLAGLALKFAHFQGLHPPQRVAGQVTVAFVCEEEHDGVAVGTDMLWPPAVPPEALPASLSGLRGTARSSGATAAAGGAAGAAPLAAAEAEAAAGTANKEQAPTAAADAGVASSAAGEAAAAAQQQQQMDAPHPRDRRKRLSRVEDEGAIDGPSHPLRGQTGWLPPSIANRIGPSADTVVASGHLSGRWYGKRQGRDAASLLEGSRLSGSLIQIMSGGMQRSLLPPSLCSSLGLPVLHASGRGQHGIAAGGDGLEAAAASATPWAADAQTAAPQPGQERRKVTVHTVTFESSAVTPKPWFSLLRYLRPQKLVVESPWRIVDIDGHFSQAGTGKPLAFGDTDGLLSESELLLEARRASLKAGLADSEAIHSMSPLSDAVGTSPREIGGAAKAVTALQAALVQHIAAAGQQQAPSPPRRSDSVQSLVEAGRYDDAAARLMGDNRPLHIAEAAALLQQAHAMAAEVVSMAANPPWQRALALEQRVEDRVAAQEAAAAPAGVALPPSAAAGTPAGSSSTSGASAGAAVPRSASTAAAASSTAAARQDQAVDVTHLRPLAAGSAVVCGRAIVDAYPDMEEIGWLATRLHPAARQLVLANDPTQRAKADWQPQARVFMLDGLVVFGVPAVADTLLRLRKALLAQLDAAVPPQAAAAETGAAAAAETTSSAAEASPATSSAPGAAPEPVAANAAATTAAASPADAKAAAELAAVRKTLSDEFPLRFARDVDADRHVHVLSATASLIGLLKRDMLGAEEEDIPAQRKALYERLEAASKALTRGVEALAAAGQLGGVPAALQEAQSATPQQMMALDPPSEEDEDEEGDEEGEGSGDDDEDKDSKAGGKDGASSRRAARGARTLHRMKVTFGGRRRLK